MPDCGKCDLCVYRQTGIKPEPRTDMGMINYNTDCRARGIEYIDIADFTMPESLNQKKQQIIHPGQALLAYPAPEGGYLILLRASDIAPIVSWDALGDYLRNTVRLRFGTKPMKVEIQIHG